MTPDLTGSSAAPSASALLEASLDAARAPANRYTFTRTNFETATAVARAVDLLRRAGAQGLVVDLGVVDAAGHDVLGTALEAGETEVLGVVPSTDGTTTGATADPTDPTTDTALVDRVVRWLDMLGLDPEVVGPLLGVAPTCGMSGASYAWARQALTLAQQTAGHLP
jgi:hypothetical protein